MSGKYNRGKRKSSCNAKMPVYKKSTIKRRKNHLADKFTFAKKKYQKWRNLTVDLPCAA